MMNDETTIIARKTRWYRKWHKRIGIFSLLILLVISISGLLLIWKKNSNGLLLADSRKGSSTELSDWISFKAMSDAATAALKARYGDSISLKISRIDARPDKGMVKVIFEEHLHAIQLDATNGRILHYEERRADFIEQIHDGTFIDNIFGTKGYAKLIYGTVAGLCLAVLTISGFWIWYNPKRIKKAKAGAGAKRSDYAIK
jgi:uncharacterized iron-regulated membrane protein